MPTRPRRIRDAAGRPPTAVELLRRAQILDATIAVVAREGAAAFTLQRVADEIGITKAAVIYHVGSKEQLLGETSAHVLGGYVAHIGERVDAATDAAGAVEAYVRAQIGWLRTHRDHARLIVEAMADPGSGVDDEHRADSRHDALAMLLEAAGGFDTSTARIRAVLVAGAVDAAISAWIDDDAFDLTTAEAAVVGFALAR